MIGYRRCTNRNEWRTVSNTVSNTVPNTVPNVSTRCDRAAGSQILSRSCRDAAAAPGASD